MNILGYHPDPDEETVTLSVWGDFLAAALEEWDVEPSWIAYACSKPWKWHDEFAYWREHGHMPERSSS